METITSRFTTVELRIPGLNDRAYKASLFGNHEQRLCAVCQETLPNPKFYVSAIINKPAKFPYFDNKETIHLGQVCSEACMKTMAEDHAKEAYAKMLVVQEDFYKAWCVTYAIAQAREAYGPTLAREAGIYRNWAGRNTQANGRQPMVCQVRTTECAVVEEHDFSNFRMYLRLADPQRFEELRKEVRKMTKQRIQERRERLKN
jgi:hypothetical protein